MLLADHGRLVGFQCSADSGSDVAEERRSDDWPGSRLQNDDKRGRRDCPYVVTAPMWNWPATRDPKRSPAHAASRPTAHPKRRPRVFAIRGAMRASMRAFIAAHPRIGQSPMNCGSDRYAARLGLPRNARLAFGVVQPPSGGELQAPPTRIDRRTLTSTQVVGSGPRQCDPSYDSKRVPCEGCAR